MDNKNVINDLIVFVKANFNYLEDCFNDGDYVNAYKYSDIVKRAIKDICDAEDNMLYQQINKVS